MRRTLLLWALIASVPAAVFGWDRTDVDTVEIRYSNGRMHEQFQQVFWGGNDETQKHGFYRSWYENGRQEWDGQYESGQKSQTWIHWDSTGTRIEEICYREGVKDGRENTWNPNGTLRTELQYLNDKLHGLCIWYRASNNIDGEYNNPCLTFEAQRFYVDGIMLLPIQETTDKPCLEGLVGGGEPYHNVENDLWIERDQRNTNFYVGRQIARKKHGIWILWSASGDMERVDIFDNGRQLKY
jgi:hypothetical protein